MTSFEDFEAPEVCKEAHKMSSRRKYCLRHLGEYRKTLGDSVKERQISGDKFLFCSYPGCVNQAQYNIEIEQKGSVVL